MKEDRRPESGDRTEEASGLNEVWNLKITVLEESNLH
jgi:hypothetical protein